MVTFVNFHSNKKGELNKFLSSFYNTDIGLYDELTWKKEYSNPIEITELIGTFIDNIDDFSINMWICLDNNIYINVTEQNANSIIKYMYERFPY